MEQSGEGGHALQPPADRDWTHAHPDPKYEVVVFRAPKYIPNSGPPLAPIGILPIHDLEGIIEDVRNIDGHAHYIVSYEHKPALRMSVRVENARDYVSARTLEDWEWQQTKIRNALEQEDPEVRERQAREEEFLEMKESARERAALKKKPKRPFGKRKRRQGGALMKKASNMTDLPPGAGMGIGMPAGPDSESDKAEARQPSFTSPKRPSTSSPSKQRGLADLVASEMESGDEDESEDPVETAHGRYADDALNRQLFSTNSTSLASKSDDEDESGDQIEIEHEDHTAGDMNRQSNEIPPGLVHSKQPKQDSQLVVSSTPLSTHNTSLASKRSRAPSTTSRDSDESDTGRGGKRRKTVNLDDSVASISSRAAFETFELLENGKKGWRPRSVADAPDKQLPVRDTSTTPVASKSKLPRSTKAQSNKANFDAKRVVQTTLPHTPAIPSRLRQSYSPRRSERSSSRDQDIPGRRRSDRGSSRASVNYTIPPPLNPADLEPDLEPEPKESEEYEVEAIVGEMWRTIKGKKSKVLYYCIKWHGYDEETWEPQSNVGQGSVDEWELVKLEAEKKRQPRITPKKPPAENDDASPVVATPVQAVKVHPFFLPKSSGKKPNGS